MCFCVYMNIQTRSRSQGKLVTAVASRLTSGIEGLGRWDIKWPHNPTSSFSQPHPLNVILSLDLLLTNEIGKGDGCDSRD